MALELPFGIRSTNPVPVENTRGPYTSLAEARSAIPLAIRHDGMTVMITGLGEYWWLNSDLSDNGLLAKTTSGSASPLTTQGDLYTYNNGVNARFPIGLINQALTVGASNTLVYKTLTTGDIPENPSSLYYTNTRVDSRIIAQKGVANGITPLDSANKVPLIHIPDALIGAVIYQGTWNATTNTPTLTSSVGTKGHYYYVNVAGTTSLDGNTTWNVGDFAIYSGSVWQRIPGQSAAVVSFNGRTGPVDLLLTDVLNALGPQNANKVFAGPASGSDATASFRFLNFADIKTGFPAFQTGRVLSNDGTNLVWIDSMGGVTSFNTRSGPITLTSQDVTDALGYTPLSSPLTTKGDIFVRNNSTNTRLPLGADLTVLVADSDTTTGLKWSTEIPYFKELSFTANGNSSYTVTHSFNNEKVMIQVVDSTGLTVLPTVTRTTTQATITFNGIAPTSGIYTVLVTGIKKITIGSDITAPIATFSPSGGSTNFSVTSNITIDLNEIGYTTSGIILSNSNIASVVELRLTNSSGSIVPSSVTISGTTITINPTSDLTNSTTYYVALLPIEDVLGNTSITQSITFTTISSTPSGGFSNGFSNGFN